MERQKELDLNGRVAIVTGASRGVGRQVSLDLARRGVKVALVARTVDRDPELPGSLGETARLVEEAGGEALIIQADLAERADLKRIIDETVARFGGVDILVNNAASTVGTVWSKPFLDITFDEWSRDFDINLHAPFILMQLVTPIMAQRGGGRIINITTGSAEAHRRIEEEVPPASKFGFNATTPSYFASKRALDRLANIIAPELRQHNVFVVGLHPGWVASEVVSARLASRGFSPKKGEARPIDTVIPARMIIYFAACSDPAEYTGRLFVAEREMEALGISRSELGNPALATRAPGH